MTETTTAYFHIYDRDFCWIVRRECASHVSPSHEEEVKSRNWRTHSLNWTFNIDHGGIETWTWRIAVAGWVRMALGPWYRTDSCNGGYSKIPLASSLATYPVWAGLKCSAIERPRPSNHCFDRNFSLYVLYELPKYTCSVLLLCKRFPDQLRKFEKLHDLCKILEVLHRPYFNDVVLDALH